MITLHIKVLSGENTHHTLEALFKAAGRAVSTAVELDSRRISEIHLTKGLFEPKTQARHTVLFKVA